MNRASFTSSSVIPPASWGRQGDLDPVVDVEPLGMVVHLLRPHRGLGHEAPGRDETAETVFAGERVALGVVGPARAQKVLQRLVAGGSFEFLGHQSSSVTLRNGP